MKIKAVIAAVVLAALSLTGCSAPSEKGLEYLQEEEYDKAIEEFQKAVDKDDNPGDAYRGIGIAKWEQEDYEGALEAFKSRKDGHSLQFHRMLCASGRRRILGPELF